MGRKRPLLIRFTEKYVVDNSGCWLWTGAKTGNGYGVIWINGEYVAAHRASYAIHIHSIGNGGQVCHKCDTPLCVNPDHLYLGSHQDNMNDRNRRHRQAHGVRNAGAKLNELQVLRIRASKLKTAALADLFKVSKSTICRIKKHKTWGHI